MDLSRVNSPFDIDGAPEKEHRVTYCDTYKIVQYVEKKIINLKFKDTSEI